MEPVRSVIIGGGSIGHVMKSAATRDWQEVPA
jgi:hypothetical protein